jgi:hypothetical protein
MIEFSVTNRFSGAIEFTAEIDCAEDAPTSIKLGLAVKWAIKAGASLAGADLACAYLAGANLAGAYFTGANLACAYLASASLAGADLACADLAGADLAGANLARAYLAGADLAGANLVCAYLAGADLADANLAGANLAGASLAGADFARAYHLIDGGQRSDGYRFVGWIKDGVLQIRAGCRSFDIAAARAHWLRTRSGTALGEETMAILDHVDTVAKIRGLIRSADKVNAT